jgi:hypothetical protein
LPEYCPPWVGKKLSLSAETRGNLLTSFRRVLAEDTRIEWLNKGSASINPDSTPEFFVDATTSAESDADAESVAIEEPPPESAG